MILSICIPIYNTDIRPLATELHRQIQAYSSEVELLFLDDASDVFFKELNRSVGRFSDYQELPSNVGRSKIRNAFLPFVKGTYLLFIDGDSEITSSDFIKRYVKCLKSSEKEVVIGASIYADIKPPRKQLLRWKYSRTRECKSFEERVKHPQLGFKSNNFLISKTVFAKNPFDESLTTYGHEDTLFGYYLRKAKVKIEQLDNSVLNSNLDENQVFLEKTKEALQNLMSIAFRLNDPSFTAEHHLLSLAIRIEKNVLLSSVILVMDRLLLTSLKGFLSKGYFTLWMFDLYRLIYLNRFLTQYRLKQGN
jgi:glycosyltransferase involved in cell wall biosynthesis